MLRTIFRPQVTLYGSLAFTGAGHATDRAAILGLAGFMPDSYDADAAEVVLADIRATGRVRPPGLNEGSPPLEFDPRSDVVFDFGPPLLGHANGMIIRAMDSSGAVVLQETYYSIGTNRHQG